MIEPNKSQNLKAIIVSGKLPAKHEFFQGADLVITDKRTEFRDLEHKTVIISRHAREISWLVFQLKDIYFDSLNAGNKYDFYTLIGDIICEQMNEDGDIIEAMLNAVDEIELAMSKKY